MKIRVSLVDYLNSAPLGWGLLYGPFKERFQVLPSSPARCAEQLATGEADIGLIPSIEYQRIPDLQIIPGISVSALNAVRSVLLVQPHDGEAIQSVALDISSRTSVVLLKLLLRSFGREPRYEELPPDLPEMLRRHDAALIIGDAALRLSPDEFRITDLASEWINWQKKPFVFAFWACRTDLALEGDLVEVFHSAREWGLQHRDEIVTSFSRRLDLPAPFLQEYLIRNIDYDFSTQHREGLERFYQLAFEAGHTTRHTPARFLATQVESRI